MSRRRFHARWCDENPGSTPILDAVADKIADFLRDNDNQSAADIARAVDHNYATVYTVLNHGCQRHSARFTSRRTGNQRGKRRRFYSLAEEAS